ncbi:hypothetical protein M408DRAFT_331473 [Serendipita vermifera MAFF 305830]|uniref:Uncharacterized protein n=1 Tax=Serendipita vermifera MAFF 305830 TaxID=933852 RepID=A0A0C3B0E2_SERVB|nr:hypothetical protein M408DRAFT_331473 [Serendipita vermifera MAFF 305830]
MPFSLSAKPPKPKPKKTKDKVVVRSSGRGGSGNIRKKVVPKEPPVASDAASTVSGAPMTPATISTTVSPAPVSPLPASDAASGKLSRITSTSGQSKTGSSFSADGGETEDRIKAPVGREILTARHRKLYTGRGGSGNAHKLVADESVYQRVLLHEQGIIQAYHEERKERAGSSTGRGGSGNIKRKKPSSGSETSSMRTRSSGKSWNSFTRRYRNTQTSNSSDYSLSPTTSNPQGFQSNDFGSMISPSILERAGIFDRVVEEDESQPADPPTSSHVTTAKKTSESHNQPKPPVKVVVTSEPDVITSPSPVVSSPISVAETPSTSHIPPQLPRLLAAKKTPPSAAVSTSWIANRFHEPVFGSLFNRASPPNVPSTSSSASSLVARSMTAPVAVPASASGSVDGSNMSDTSSLKDEKDILPGTTPTQPLSIRKANSPNAAQVMTNDQSAAVRARSASLNTNQANRNVNIYGTQALGSLQESPIDPSVHYTGYTNNPPYFSNLPYLPSHAPSASNPSSRNHGSPAPPPKRPLPPSPAASKTLDLPRGYGTEAARHSREMSSSSTSGSDLDLSRYNFPDAPGHQPTTRQREIEPRSLDMLVESSTGGVMMRTRFPPEPRATPPPPPLSRASSRAPVMPGAYQAALRSELEGEVPEGPPPLYQPRASRRYPTDLSPDQDYSEPSTPTLYSYRVASPASSAGAPSTRMIDASNPILRPNQRTPVPASPLSEAYSPPDGSPTEKYISEVRSNEKAHYYGGGHYQRLNTRRPSDPYHRVLVAAATAAKNSTPPPFMSRRGSPSQSQGQSQGNLSPTSAMSPHSFNSDTLDSASSYEPSTSSDLLRSRPTSQTFSTYTRGTNQSNWETSQATATAVDHHEHDFPQEDDDGHFYTSMLADLDGHEDERRRLFKEAMLAKTLKIPSSPVPSSSSTAGKENSRMYGSRVPPVPKHLMAAVAGKQQAMSEPGASPPSSRQLPMPPISRSTTPRPAPVPVPVPARTPTPTSSPAPSSHPLFPGGMGWDELNQPAPRKLSKMEKALLRRVEFGPNITAADVATIPLA